VPAPTQPSGHWQGIDVHLQLRLAAATAAWFWHLSLHNTGAATQVLDLVLVHDIGLAPYAATRLNEYYVSHYVDLAPLTHPQRGALLAARQNQPVAGRHPWALVGSLRRGARRATDALQVLGLDVRCGGLPRASCRACRARACSTSMR
jgi:cellobiose phosphorylase